jgi:uncharacterized small protein (DUF1192 family)|tara:strand:+ start:1250 stop:1852 length:603 start_codon:yes stop_codon:yes gene_type:complete
MEVQIKEKGKLKKFKLINNWSDVNLETFQKLIKFHTGSKSKEALNTIAELSNIPKDLINKLEISDVAAIMSRIAKLQSEQNRLLKKVIEIDGVRYGFHPDLDSITLGEYADIETFIKNDIDKSLPEAMSILFRPIVKETSNGVYTIEAYDGETTIRAEVMKKMAAEQVQNALVFFWTFVSVLLEILQSYLKEQKQEKKKQ